MSRRHVLVSRLSQRLAVFVGALLLSAASLALATHDAAAQTGQIVGTVSDASSGAPLSEVQVYIPDASVGVLSRQDGRFLLLNVPAGTFEVRAERIGYSAATQQVTVTGGGSATVEFRLAPEALGLDEIVVTGTAGAARRREIGNTVSQINVTDVPGRPVATTDILQSSAPGVEVTAGGGPLGNGSRIVLRGNSSVSMSNQPIIYVDGVRMMSGSFPQTTARDYRPGRGANVTASPLDNINPNDIERIEIIKGSAATTLYGTEASAGVIQVFTKRGSQGAPVWTVETQQGAMWSPKFGIDPEPYNRMDPWLGTGWDQQYFGSVRGGAENLQYFVSGQYNDATGVMPLDELEKWVVRGNFSFTPAENLQLQFNTNYSNQWQKNTPGGNNAQGLTLNAFRGEANYFGTLDYDVVSQVLEYDIQQDIERFTTGGTVTYSPLSNLTNRLTIGYDFSQQEARNLRPFGFVFYPQGALMNNKWENRVLTFDYTGTYSFDVSQDIRTSVSWGGQAIGDEERELEGWGEDFPGAAEPTVSSASIKIAEESRQRVWNAGFFFQNVLDIANRYFITAGLRVDGNSAFGEGFGLQLYPKASASWIMSDESFWNPEIGTLKLRAAYGQSGRAPGAFDAVRTWEAPGLAGRPAFIPQNVGNPDLGPEVTSELELGFDWSLLGGRLNSVFTYYRQRTDDALFDVSQVPSEGFGGSQLLNTGVTKASGIELGLDAAIVQSPDWGWDVGLNITTNKSEVVDLGDAIEFEALSAWIIEGQPVPVERDNFVTNPTEIGDPDVETGHIYGPQLPTHMLSASTTVRMPYGISVSARGEYRGGNYLPINPFSVQRTVRSTLCYPYYVNPDAGVDLRADTPALWRARCTPNLYDEGYYIWDADYFKLRSVSVTVPMDFAFPDRINSSTLTLALNNSYMWTREIPFMDPEVLSNSGANSAGLGPVDTRIPSPVTFRASLRITF